MQQDYPIYTEKTECQDCYKCLRHCPVKAIKVENGSATVMPERCVACGHCVEVCPAHAKRVRNDLKRALHLLESKKDKVYVSLAPSWKTAFPGVSAEMMIAALKRLGFAGVSETALGAEAVSAGVIETIKGGINGALISSACPSAVEFMRKYLPLYVKNITVQPSPAQSHCKMLRNIFGAEIGVVFIGPCIAKKCEADRNPELLDLALTFTELDEWFKNTAVLDSVHPGPQDVFVPSKAGEGSVYPVEGGMLETLRCASTSDVNFASICGIKNIDRAFSGLKPEDIDIPVFVETLACHGGCVNGPCIVKKSPGLAERLNIIKSVKVRASEGRAVVSDLKGSYEASPVKASEESEEKIKEALKSVGKFRKEDELNCGGCGYDSCRKFALSLIEGVAEPAMCVSFMRKQAQKKANALLRCMPSGVVIAGNDLKIIECNQRFAGMFDEATKYAYEARPGLAGAALDKIVPFTELFESVLRTGEEIHKESLAAGEKLFNVTVFIIEPGEVVGAVVSDVTRSEMKREQIAQQARDVISKNLSTVQDIAFKLGEHMAETELLLRSIAEDYGGKHPESHKWQDVGTVENRGDKDSI